MNLRRWKTEPSKAPTIRHSIRVRLRRMLVRIRRSVPNGFRLPLGILLCIGGILGFLPILGFWMLPLGVALIAMDVRWLRARMQRRQPVGSPLRGPPPDH